MRFYHINIKSYAFISIVFVDKEKPVIICPSGQTTATDSTKSYATVTLPPVSATDNEGVANVTSTHASGTHQFPVGTTTIMHTAMDQSGNVASCSFNIIVNGNGFNTIGCLALGSAKRYMCTRLGVRVIV